MSTSDALPALRAEIDRKQLRTVLARFRAISAARLERVRAMLDERGRQFVDVLPLLLHANHPALPGYVSQHTPAGIPGYKPGSGALGFARRLARSFTHHASPGSAGEEHGVEAVYLMGSSGTLGHSDSSDLDVWICYPESLDNAALTLLQRKTELLTGWARGWGVNTHLFLMNGEKFRRGQREPLTGENCGTAQHYLLLDEFYRTGILLAGRLPAWWLVPPEREDDYEGYVEELTQRRHVRGGDLLDFGGIHGVPAGEFVGAGIWQLYKAIDSPYKSVLKLLLFEVYAARFPHTECLSADYKRAVYAGVTDIDELDPYVMLHRRLEAHLLRAGQVDRVELMRRCLYYKAGKKLARPPQHRIASWQRRLMERLTTDWGWDRAKLALLDARSGWSIHELAAERNALVRELTNSYRFLAEFARSGEAARSIDAREFAILGRKYQAAYERKAGKVETLNPGTATDVSESELSICAAHSTPDPAGAPLWAAYAELVGARSQPEGRALHRTACLAELLAWCVVNGVIGERTRVAVREAVDGLRHVEVDAMLREIRACILPARASGALDDAAFAAPARPLALLVFVDVAAEPMSESRETGLQRVSSRTDSLGYSARRDNLVLNLETVSCNSWGEVVAARYAGEEGLLRCLRDYLQMPGLHGDGTTPPLPVVVRCFCVSRATAIAARVEELFADLRRVFHSRPEPADARYVFAIGSSLQLVQMQRGVASTQVADGQDALLGLLAAPQRAWSPVTIDRHALRGSSLLAVCERLEPGRVSVFCETLRDGVRLIVGDERGSLFHCDYAGMNEQSALAALAQFLVSVRLRQNSSVFHDAVAPADDRPRFHRLVRAHGRAEYGVQPQADPLRPGAAFLNVQAIGEPADGERVRYAVWCEGVSFTETETGARFHAELAAHIRARRTIGGSDYPVYITDLDLSAVETGEPRPLQTVRYLLHRQRLEAAINASLAGAG